MHPPRPFQETRYDKDMFTFLPASNTDGLAESSRKRKLITYDHQVPMPNPALSHGISGISSPKLNTGDLRDKGLENSLPASPRGASLYFKHHPHKNQSWDQKNHGASWDFDKRNRHETRSECNGCSSSRGQSQSFYHNDFSPLPAEKNHKTSKWAASMTKDFKQFENLEVNEQKVKGDNACHFQEFWNCDPKKPFQMEVFGATNSWDEPSKYIGVSKSLPQVLETGTFAVDFHKRDHQACKASKWSPLKTDAVNCLGQQVPNTHMLREGNASDFLDFHNSGTQKPEQLNVITCSSYDKASKNLSESQSRQKNFLNPQSAAGFGEMGCQTQKALKWHPLVSEHCNQFEIYGSIKEHLVSHSQEFQNCAPQALAQIKAVASSSLEQESRSIEGSQSLNQNFLNTVAFNTKGGNEETDKVESSLNVKVVREASSFIGFDNTKTLGDNVGSPDGDLQDETNKLLQNALRLLSAASSIVSADNSGGKVQGQNDIRLMKLLLDSSIQNLKTSLVESAISKNIEVSPNVDKFHLNDEKGDAKLDNQCNSENKASSLTEKLWDGTLQLSSSVSLSAVAFFKSGEKVPDLCWSESVEVKGKVKLEAFEKYVQDLPRSRSRGLMVMSFCCKEDSSDAVVKDMKEVAQKYEERKKVGFAQLSNGVDLYICPHSDAVITILAKHGFFKGISAVIDKSDPLIGCVVWRKNASLVPSSKAIEAQTLQSSVIVHSESSTVVNKSKEVISFSSVEGGTAEGEKRPQFETNMELDRSNLQPPSVVTEHSVASSSDDDDLPEYDFGAVVSRTSVNGTPDIGAVDSGFASENSREDNPRSMSVQMRSESSTILRTSPDFHFQGLVSQSMERHSSSHSLSFPIGPQKQMRECTESSKPPYGHFQGSVSQNGGHIRELENSSIQAQQKEIEKCVANPKSSTLFDEDEDDDDIPEWCPTGFTKPDPKIAQGAGLKSDFRHSEVHVSGFAHSPSRLLPPAPPSQLQVRDKEHPTTPHLPKSLASNTLTNESMHKGSEVPISRFACSPSRLLPPAPPSQLQLRNKEHPSTPHLPKSLASITFTNESMHKGSDVPISGFAHSPSRLLPLAPPSQLQLRNKEHPSAPHLPKSLASNTLTNDSMNKGCDFARSLSCIPRFDCKASPSPDSLMHKGSNFARDTSSRPRFDPVASDGLAHKFPDFPQNPASSRPQFDPKPFPCGNDIMHKGSDYAKSPASRSWFDSKASPSTDHKGPPFCQNPTSRPRFDPKPPPFNDTSTFAQNSGSRNSSKSPASRPWFNSKASPSTDHKGPQFAQNHASSPRFDPKPPPFNESHRQKGPYFAQNSGSRTRYDRKGKPVHLSKWRGSRP